MRFVSEEYDVEAWIEYTVDWSRLPEHREQSVAAAGDEKYAKQAGYLEIEEEKDFRICYTFHKPMRRTSGFEVSPSLDGRTIQGILMRPEDPASYHIDYMNVDEGGEIRKGALTFSALKTSEDAEVETRGKDVDRLCVIELKFTVGTSTPSLYTQMRTGVKASVGKVHEKQLKLGSTIAPRTTEPMPRMQLYDFYPHPGQPEVCVFVWRLHIDVQYFTKDMLIIKGIIEDDRPPPRVPTPPPHDAGNAGADMDVKREALGDVKPNIKPNVGKPGARPKRKRDSMSKDKQGPVHGSAERPFKIDNEDSDDEVVLDVETASKRKKRVSEMVDLRD